MTKALNVLERDKKRKNARLNRHSMCCPKIRRERKCKVKSMCSMALNVLERDEKRECKVEPLCSKALNVLQIYKDRKTNQKKMRKDKTQKKLKP
jgi:hypothetical protein